MKVAKYMALFFLLASTFQSVISKSPLRLRSVVEVAEVKYVHMANTLVFGVFYQTVLGVCETASRSDADRKIKAMLLLKR